MLVALVALVALALSGCRSPSSPQADAGLDAFVPRDSGCEPCVEDGGRDASRSDDAGGTDTGPIDAGVPCGPVEHCDGVIDDDCDRSVDEGCACVPGTPTTLAGAPVYLADALAVTTSGYAVAASSPVSTSYDTYVLLADRAFRTVGSPTVIPGLTGWHAESVRMAVQGTDIGTLHRRVHTFMGTELWFARVSAASGVITSGPTNLGSGLLFDIVAAPSGGFVQSYPTLPGIGVRALTLDGAPGATGANTSAGGEPQWTAAAVGGAGVIGVAYDARAAGDVRFQRFDAALAPLGEEIVLTADLGSPGSPSIAGDANGWWIAWGQREGDLPDAYRLAHVDADGVVDVAPHEFARSHRSGHSLSLATDGAGGVGALFASDGGTHFAIFDATGAATESRTLIRVFEALAGGHLVHDGARFVAVIAGPALIEPCVPR